MLIPLPFNEARWRREHFNPDPQIQSELRYHQTETEFWVEILVDGKWELCAGYEQVECPGCYWSLGGDFYIDEYYGRQRVIHGLLDMAFRRDKLEERFAMIRQYPLDFYGVGDSPAQILAHPGIKTQFLDPTEEQYILCCTSVRKEHQSASPPVTAGGWRWEKNGEYIGNQKSQADYLADEPEIEEVVEYHFFRILPETPERTEP